jgi:hypothetical protein
MRLDEVDLDHRNVRWGRLHPGLLSELRCDPGDRAQASLELADRLGLHQPVGPPSGLGKWPPSGSPPSGRIDWLGGGLLGMLSLPPQRVRPTRPLPPITSTQNSRLMFIAVPPRPRAGTSDRGRGPGMLLRAGRVAAWPKRWMLDARCSEDGQRALSCPPARKGPRSPSARQAGGSPPPARRRAWEPTSFGHRRGPGASTSLPRCEG